ncbi:hypothetical protein [Bradyrhizobium sp. sBnM-33]|uniref:hypothetical protein n=1 Tax=Bradyrhizobium sp. sBnM-33 TaxID=2831780 RepID=UPI001BD063A1|nr:hypothetical protein [Bradyrhizobium sp. sBnM-33]
MERQQPLLDDAITVKAVLPLLLGPDVPIGGYNNFLRLRLAEDGFGVFVIGLEEVPDSEGWAANPKHNKDSPIRSSPRLFRRSISNLT